MTEPLTITIPMTPPHQLSPNASLHIKDWTRNTIRREWQRAWFLSAYNVVSRMDKRHLPFAGPVRCTITVYRKKGAKPWDGDNLLAAMKHGIDQLQAAGVVANDRQITYDPVQQERDPDGAGYMVVTLTPAEAVQSS